MQTFSFSCPSIPSYPSHPTLPIILSSLLQYCWNKGQKGSIIIHTLTSRFLSGPFWKKAFYSEEGGVSKMSKVNYLFAFAPPSQPPSWQALRTCCLLCLSQRSHSSPLDCYLLLSTLPFYPDGLNFLAAPQNICLLAF